jgi:argininosuccinate lyase
MCRRMENDYLGDGGRLAGGPAPELVAAGYATETAHGPRLAHDLSLSDLAHAVALAEAGVISPERASALIAGLLELHEIPGDRFPWRPELGDAFNSREHELTARVGADAAGWLSAGRPRREAFRVALRLRSRRGALTLHDRELDLAEALLGHAERHAGDLAADYTYLQPAQPTTIGHLLLAYAYPAMRDAERMRRVHGLLDVSVAGAGGSAGSRWPIDRARLAELLGFHGLVPHVRDAMWQTDAYLELLGAVATAATHQSQIGQDLEILASQEFGAVSLADRHSRASALMPQKRNPYALAVIREAAAAAAGDLAAAHVALHTGSARTDHFHALNGLVPRRLDHAEVVTHLAAEVVAGMTLDPARMADAARRGFTQAADVADVIAQHGGVDYRTAHTVVGRAVRELVEAGEPPERLTAATITAAAETLGVSVTIDDAVLAEAMDPARCARERPQRGSSAPDEVRRMLAECHGAIDVARSWSATAAERAAAAEGALLARAAALARPA